MHLRLLPIALRVHGGCVFEYSVGVTLLMVSWTTAPVAGGPFGGLLGGPTQSSGNKTNTVSHQIRTAYGGLNCVRRWVGGFLGGGVRRVVWRWVGKVVRCRAVLVWAIVQQQQQQCCAMLCYANCPHRFVRVLQKYIYFVIYGRACSCAWSLCTHRRRICW